MNLSKRKKKPPDLLIFLSSSCSGGCLPATLTLLLSSSASFSPLAPFPSLDLYHSRGQSLCSDYLWLLLLSDLPLHDLQGDRSSGFAGSGDWSSHLLAPASSASPLGDPQQHFGPDLHCSSGGTPRFLRWSSFVTLFGKVCISFSVLPSPDQGTGYFPLFSFIVLKDYTRPSYLYVLQNINSESCVCWLSSLRFLWHWSSLGLTRLIGVVNPIVTEFWVFRLKFTFSKWWSCTFEKLGSLEYGFEFTHGRPFGDAWLLFQVSLLTGCTMTCFPFWVRLLFFRLVHTLLLGHSQFVAFHIGYHACLLQIH